MGRLLALAVAVSVVANPVAQAGPHRDGQLVPAAKRLAGLTGGQLIGEDTRLLLEHPAAENPLAGAGESCFRAGRRGKALIVWTRPEAQAPECIVKPGTSVFLFGAWVFCDEVEPPPFFAVGEEAQRKCALEGLRTLLKLDAILVTVDGRRPVDIARKRFLAVSAQGTAQYPKATSSASLDRRRRSSRRGTWRCFGRCVQGSTRSRLKSWADRLRASRRPPSTSCPAPEHTRAQGAGRPDPSGAWLEPLTKP